MTTKFKAGDRVQAHLYGMPHTGTVAIIGQSVIFVRWDGATNLRWVFPESLTLVEAR